jgi:hypothetical protein
MLWHHAGMMLAQFQKSGGAMIAPILIDKQHYYCSEKLLID